ncbi:MAG: hypothetical protein DWQ37_11410 [Planctomycetota bacterium]|nr:MAG: hypothetical protein DWQ37_11410 [Planctomycetota bacterium]
MIAVACVMLPMLCATVPLSAQDFDDDRYGYAEENARTDRYAGNADNDWAWTDYWAWTDDRAYEYGNDYDYHNDWYYTDDWYDDESDFDLWYDS